MASRIDAELNSYNVSNLDSEYPNQVINSPDMPSPRVDKEDEGTRLNDTM
jgi:hypothetical protein